MVGDFATEFIRPTSVSGKAAIELIIKSKTAYPFSFKQGIDRHPWFVVQQDRYFITIRYSASEDILTKYADAFIKAIESFTFIK